MSNSIDESVKKSRNMLYYNQLVKNDKKVQTKKEIKRKKSFASKKFELKDFAPVPDGWEYFVYAFYAVCVPYLLGAVFLFLAVAGGNFNNFMLLNTNAFVVVWLIGYEILSVLVLCWILVLYLKYEDEETYY